MPESGTSRTGQPQLALSLDRKEGSRVEVERSFESYDPLRDPSMRPTPFQAYVRIMIGCDKFCTYCIVPSVRGPEQSRPPEHIAGGYLTALSPRSLTASLAERVGFEPTKPR